MSQRNIALSVGHPGADRFFAALRLNPRAAGTLEVDGVMVQGAVRGLVVGTGTNSTNRAGGSMTELIGTPG